MAIEETGAAIDEDLVNKVFRAAHSVKGAAGFMGLDSIKDLSHKIENVLGMIRNGEVVPDSEVVNILLLAFDKLRDMVNHVQESNDTDISEHVVALDGIKTAYLPEATKNEVTEKVDIALPDGTIVFSLPRFDVSHAISKDQKVCLVEYDLIHDIHRRGMTPLVFLNKLQDCARIIDCRVEVPLVGTLSEEEIINCIPLFVLLAVDAPMSTAEALGVDEDKVYLWEDLSVQVAETHDPADILAPPDQWTPTPQNQRNACEPPPLNGPASEKPADSGEGASVSPAAEVTPKPKTRSVRVSKSAPVETTLRVNIKVLDTLMNLAGELVLSRNELVQAVAANEANLVASATQRINLVTSELQEAIVLRESLSELDRFDIKILGTDISDAAVAVASYGKYNRFEVERGLSPERLDRYFERHGDGWWIKDEIRLMTSFQKFSLLHDFQALGQFDVIFCRNVAIYFSTEGRKQLFHRIARMLRAHGSLIIGASEYLAGICDRFQSHRHLRSVYYTLACPTAPGLKEERPCPDHPNKGVSFVYLK